VSCSNSVRQGADGRWHEAGNSRRVDFAASTGDAALASFGVDATYALSYTCREQPGWLRWCPAIRLPTKVFCPGPTWRWRPPRPARRSRSSCVPRGTANSWVFPSKLTGLTPQLASDGSVNLVDASGTAAERIPRGYAFDSKVDPVSGEPATTYAVGFALTTDDGAPALRVTLDAGWLADPARVFPVTVDPTFTEVSSSTYAEVSAPVGDHSMEKTIKIGSYNSGPDSANSFLLFPKDLDNSGVQVSSASLRLFDTWASTCTASRPDVAPVTQSWTPPG
jgi:hypothetical protein